MKVLITGTTGFVGKNLKSFLYQREYNITEVNRTKVIPGSFTFGEAVKGACSAEAWVHLAAKANDIVRPKLLDEYIEANVELTKKLFSAFINDPIADTFIYVSTIKAAAAIASHPLTEDDELEVDIPYGASKRMAEKYLLSVQLPPQKKLVILRPTMVYGYNKSSNLYSLYKLVKNGLPYPFAAFTNSRTMLSIDNLVFVIWQIIKNKQFKPGIYNVADDEPVSTNQLIDLMGTAIGKKPVKWNIPVWLVRSIASIGDVARLPINTKKINKLTESYIVSNTKLKQELKEPLPWSAKESLLNLFSDFNKQ